MAKKTILKLLPPPPDPSQALYNRHRPQTLADVKGQPDAVKVLQEAVRKNRVPHVVLFTGPSGVGKTTLVRILAAALGVKTTDPHNYHEYNCSDFRGIDTVREIRDRASFSGFGKTSKRVYYLDEVHKMTGDAQNATLKMLEDEKSHLYFFLATSDPGKVIKAVHTRCLEVRLQAIDLVTLKTLVTDVAKAEGMAVGKAVVSRVAEAADGSARKALVLLQSLQGIDGEAEQLRVVEKNDSKAPAIAIARVLLNPRATWAEVAKTLRDNADEDPEGLRRMILGYCGSILVNGRDDRRASMIVSEMRDNLFDSGKAGLVACCHAVWSNGKR